MNIEQLVEWELAEESEVLGKNVLQYHFSYHKSNITWPVIELGMPHWEAED
jgi:hypothetical protein